MHDFSLCRLWYYIQLFLVIYFIFVLLCKNPWCFDVLVLLLRWLKSFNKIVVLLVNFVFCECMVSAVLFVGQWRDRNHHFLSGKVDIFFQLVLLVHSFSLSKSERCICFCPILAYSKMNFCNWLSLHQFSKGNFLITNKLLFLPTLIILGADNDVLLDTHLLEMVINFCNCTSYLCFCFLFIRLLHAETNCWDVLMMFRHAD